MNQKVLPIGLDIGHSSIKMLQLASVDGRLKLLGVERAPLSLEPDMAEHHKRGSITAAIKQLLDRGRFKGRRAVSALSSDGLRITSLRVPETETLQVDKTVRKEAAQRFGMDPERDTINHLLAGSVRQGDDLKNEFIVLAAENETIRRHISLLEEAGLEPAGIDAAPCALFRNFERTMRREEDKQRTIIFMDIGHRWTTVVFGRSGEICLVKQIPSGTARFSEDVAATLNITVADATSLRLKLQRGESVDTATRRATVDALVLAAEQLVKELSLCLRYHTVTFRGKRVERAIIAGGGAYESVFVDVLRRHLSVEIEIAEPLRGFDLSDAQLDDDAHHSSADLALAVGLSLKGDDGSGPAGTTSRARPEPVLEGKQT